MPFFLPRAIEKWRPGAQEVAKELAGGVATASESLDLNTSFCEPFITQVVSSSTGIPREDCPRVFSLVERNLSLVETPEDREQIKGSWRELYAYTRELLADKRRQPDGSILSDVVGALDRKGMTEEQVLHACGTVITGFPTALPVFSVASVELLTRPEIVAACQKNPNLWEPVADEVMRRKAHFAFALPRVATTDVNLGDETIRAGQLVLPSLTAAILDPNYTEDPDTFDPFKKANRNLVFGAGPHFCPGAALSRQWLEVGLRELFTQAPSLHLTVPENRLNWQKGTLSMPESIPVMPR